jgi:type VI secretion system protein ImpA
LRIALHLVQAWTWTQALPGWCAGLGLVRGLLERYWDEVYPRLDAEEQGDPTERVNAVMPLVDPQGALAALRSAVLVQSPRLGRFTLRDLRIASGTLHAPPAEDMPPPTLADIEACCLDSDAESLRAAGAAIDEALAHAQAIDGLFVDKLGPAGPELAPLLAELAEVKTFVAAQLARRFPHEAANAEAVAAPPAQDEMAATAAGAGIHSTRDVLRAIEAICEYYRRNEPSSPVPILLRRAGGLVGLGFADLLKSLAPGGLAELQAIAGGEEGGD